MQAIVAACESGHVPATVVLVVSNRADAPGLGWARQKGLATAVIPQRDFPDRESHDAAIVAHLIQAGVEWVCLAGYMRLLSSVLISAYRNRILNIHPALLPAFPGLDAQRQAWEWGVRVSGCTVHLVDEELDHGPIVVQKVVEVADDDSADSLAEKILHQEHVAYSEALRLLLTTGWKIEDRRVVLSKGGRVPQGEVSENDS